jgi:hypothetical protein
MQVTGNNIQNNSKSIRFSTGGLSLCINGKCKSFSFDKIDENFHKSMAICLCEELMKDPHIWDIYIDNPFYTIIPKEIGNKEICISAFKLNFPEINTNHIIMSEEIDRHDMISIFGIHNGLYEFIKAHFPLHKIHHYSINAIIKSIEHSKSNGTKEVWASVENNSLLINLVENGKLLLTNSFNIKTPTDCLYFIGSIYEQFDLSKKNTPLFFLGDKSYLKLLEKHISHCHNIPNLCE